VEGPVGEHNGVVADEPPPVARHRRLSRRARHLLIGVVVVVAGLVAAAVVAQNVLDRRATRRAVAVLDAYEGSNYLLSIESAAARQQMVPDDQPIVDGALARADRAQAAGYARLERALETSPFLDGSTRHLVASVRALLRARVLDLEALAAWRLRPAGSRGPQPSDPSPASNVAGQHALAAAARHAGHPTPIPTAPSPTLNLDLTRWSDASTGTLLAVGDNSAVDLVDVDTHSSFDVQLTGTAGQVVARAGYVAAVTPSGEAVAKPPTLPAGVTHLGRAGQILPAIEPDAVWLVAVGPDTATGMPTTTVTEVDGNGRRLAGPAFVPNGAFVTGGVTGNGLVIEDTGGRLAVWDPATGDRRLVTSVPAILLAASADRLAWQADDNSVVEATDLGTGTTNSVQLPQGNVILSDTDVASTTCAFAPDGGQLACPVVVLSSVGDRSAAVDPFHLAVINLGDGSVRVSPGAVGRADAHPLVWSGDGSRLWTIVASEQGSLLASWATGTPSAHELRFRVQQTMTGLAVVGG
jgi:hypothetical protein